MVSELWTLPKEWKWTNLGEVSEVISKGTTPTTLGVSFSASGVPFLRAEDVTGDAVDTKSVKFHITSDTHNSILARSKLKPGDLLITIAGTLGRVGYVPDDAPFVNCNQAVAFARLKPNVIDVKFACFACQYESIIGSLVDSKKVGTIGNLNLQQIREFQIPLPPLDEQKRIAAILAKADRLRRLRRYARELSEGYLQSVFLEMFGDPVSNPRGWEIYSFDRAILDTRNGLGQRANFSDTGVIVLRIKDVGIGSIDYSEPRRMEISSDDLNKYRLEDGDLLLVRVNGNPDLVGRAALFKAINDVVVFSDHIIRVKLDQKVCKPAYVTHLLNSPYGRTQIRSMVITTAGQFTINRSGISNVLLPYPPLPLQQKFVQIVQKHERLRAQQREAERQAEHLFQSLLHRAFRGEL